MEFNFNELSKKYTLFLYQLNEVELGELAFYENLSYAPALTEIGEISFTMRSHYSDEQGVLRETPYYHDLAADKLVLIDGKEFYFIDTCSENASDGQYTKEVHAYRREYELSLKAFNDYEPETERLLYFKYPTGPATSDGFPWKTRAALEADPSIGFIFKNTTSSDPNIMEDGYHFGIFNEIEKLTSWRLERSGGFPKIPKVRNPEPGKQQAVNDIDLSKQARMITTSEANILEVLKQIQESWNCYFEYDTVNRIIRIKTLDDLLFEENGEEKKAKGLMSDENFILDLTRDLKTEEIKTRLHLYNIDGVGVTAEMMAHGGPYLENYSYFKDTKYMSIDLMSALDLYETNLREQTDLVRVYWTEVKTLLQERRETEGLINQAELDLTSPVVDLDYYETLKTGYKDADGVVITEPRKLDTEEQKEYNRIKKVVQNLNNKINNYRTGTYTKKPRSLKTIDGLKKTSMDKLRALQNKSLMGAVFGSYETMAFGKKTGQLMKEMEPYVRDATYQSDSISEASELYTLGQNLLKQVSRLTVQFSLSVFDFLTLTELSEDWGWLKLGDIIEIRNKQLDFVNNVMLLKVIHEPESQSLTLEFSTDLKLKDDTKFIADLITNSATIASQVAFNSNYWANGGAIGVGAGDGGLGNIFDKLYANFIQTKTLVADEIFATRAEFDELLVEEIEAAKGTFVELIASEAYIKELTSEIIKTDELEAVIANLRFANIDFAEIDQAVIDSLTARVIMSDSINTHFITAQAADLRFITAENANIRFLSSDIINAETIEARQLKSDLINAIMLYAETATFQTLFAEKMLTEDGFFKDLTASGFTSVKIDAGAIVTGTLTADRILLRGGLDEDGNPIGLLLALNNIGELISENVDSLDGYVLTNDSVHADKIIANSITAKQIQAESISGTEIAANSIKTSHISTLGLDAGTIKTGTLDAALVAISNLSASSIKLDRLESLNGAFFMDMESGDFNLGGAVIKNGNNVSIRVGSQSIEDYVEGKVSHKIEVLPSQIFINTDNAGEIEEKQSFTLSIGVYEGQALKGFATTGIHLKDAGGGSIITTGFSGSAGPVPDGQEAEVLASFDKGAELKGDQGTLNFLITLADSQKQYFHKIGWSKIKAPAKQIRVEIISSNGEVFKNNLISTVLKAMVYEDNIDITDKLPASRFHWEKINSDGTPNTQWNKMFEGGAKEVPITASDVAERATFSCTII